MNDDFKAIALAVEIVVVVIVAGWIVVVLIDAARDVGVARANAVAACPQALEP